jgi:arylsulfatase A-like enzyme
MIKWPGHIAPTVSDGMFSTMVLVPTLASFVGAASRPTDRRHRPVRLAAGQAGANITDFSEH